MRVWGRWGWRSWKTWRNLLIAFVALWIFYVAAMNGINYYFLRQQAEIFPEMALMPTALSDSGVADLGNGSTVDAFGYSLRVPWGKVSKRIDSKTLTNVDFEGGGRIMIFDPAGQLDDAKVFREAKGSARTAIQKMLTPAELSSPYLLFKAEMESSPAQEGLWHSREANARVILLTTTKETFTLEGTTAIHPVAGGGMRGYEALRSKNGLELVRLRLFDGRDNQVEFWLIWPSTDPKVALAQAQINAIIASIKTNAEGCTMPGHCG